ncbi:MAG: hypothetical protein K1X79_04185 [Oligoflexia bacterium]|nr:hypothetical protein [Oligoflexia bacterium]
MKHIHLLVASALIASALPVAWAEDEDPARGRLADGRAFRTDAQGNQLVDYIAELELSVEQLKRRVNGLEFELSEKQAVIDRSSAGKGEAKVVAERDLLKGKELKPEAPVAGSNGFTSPMPKDRSELASTAPVCPEPPKCPQVSSTDGSPQEIASLRQLLEKSRFDTDVAQRVAEKGRQELQEAQKLLNTRETEHQASLAAMRTTLAKPVCPQVDCSGDVKSVAQQLSQAKAELSRTQQLLAIAQGEQINQNKTLKDVSAQLARAEARADSSEAQLAAMRGESTQLKQQLAGSASQLNGKSEALQGYEKQISLLQTKLDAAAERETALSAELSTLKSQKQDSAKLAALAVKADPVQQPGIAPAVSSTTTVAHSEASTPKAAAQPQFFGDRSSDNDERASFSSAKLRAVDTLRGVMTTELHNLRDLVATRDALFQSFNQTGRALTFKPSALISSRNYNMTWIADRIKNATNVYELSNLSRDIRDIKARVQDDIELIKRMKRVG